LGSFIEGICSLRAYSQSRYPFLDIRFKDFAFVIFQIYNLNEINLSGRYWITQIMIFSWWWWFFACICNYTQIFWLKTRNAKNEYISFYIQLNICFYMKLSYTFHWHLGPQILNLMNIKNQENRKKRIILLFALSKWIL
jgi:hypothetical protein